MVKCIRVSTFTSLLLSLNTFTSVMQLNLQNLPKNHDFVQCQYWHLHYVRRSELNDHLESCEHKLAKEANKKTWEGKSKSTYYVSFSNLVYKFILPPV